MKRIVTSFVVTLILVGALAAAFDVQPARASDTIYIRADGSIDPPTANITTSDNVTYTFTHNNYDSIVIERNNIIIDGAGLILHGVGSGVGIDLSGRNNVTVVDMEIKAFDNGIWLWGSSNNNISDSNFTEIGYTGIVLYYSSSNNSISRNIVTNNGCGILLYDSNLNSVFANNITGNSYGIKFQSFSSFNNIFDNNMTNNGCGLFVQEASNNNIFYWNNFIDNSQQIDVYGTINMWDDGYPSGGNYWSDYTDVDIFKGEYQNETGSDGVWDHLYVIDADNQDRYPLTKPFGWFPAGDVDGDSDVDIFDIVRMAGIYGVKYPAQRYDRLCDLDLDGDVDIFDIVAAAVNYAKIW